MKTEMEAGLMRHTLFLLHDLGIKSKSMHMTDICDETSLGDMSNNLKEEEEGVKSVPQDEL